MRTTQFVIAQFFFTLTSAWAYQGHVHQPERVPFTLVCESPGLGISGHLKITGDKLIYKPGEFDTPIEHYSYDKVKVVNLNERGEVALIRTSPLFHDGLGPDAKNVLVLNVGPGPTDWNAPQFKNACFGSPQYMAQGFDISVDINDPRKFSGYAYTMDTAEIHKNVKGHLRLFTPGQILESQTSYLFYTMGWKLCVDHLKDRSQDHKMITCQLQ